MESVEVMERRLTVLTTTDQRDPAGIVDSTIEAERDASLSVACALIEDLVEQMAWKDAPPSNDLVSSENHPNNFMRSPSSRTSGWHSHHHSAKMGAFPTSPGYPKLMLSPTTLQGTCSFETADSSHDILSFFQDYLRETHGGLNIFPTGHPMAEYNKALEQQMALPDRLGHTSLAALANWTLNALGVDRKSSTANIPMQIETSIVPSTPTLNVKQTPTSHQRRLWRKKRNSPTQQATQPTNTVRLQMFGSEYARHLSNSALAPAVTDARPRRHLRRNMMSWKLKPTAKTVVNPIYLDDADGAYQTGALLDIVVTNGDQAPPPGFLRLGSASHPFTLERGKKTLYLDVKKEPSWDKAVQRPCITALTIVFPDRYEFVPPGFSIVRDGKAGHTSTNDKTSHPELKENVGNPADIGLSERAFLCFRRSREGNPITSLIPLSPSAAESVPTGFTVLEKSPRNFSASIQEKPGRAIFFGYQQRLANLETLRPLPLLMSVLVCRSSPKVSSRSKREDDESEVDKLEAFYATGGTIVPAKVGRFHIMDRTTHSLLSPSSISNRLSLIEQSRISAGKKGLSITESTDLMTSISRAPSTCSSRGECWDRRVLQEGLSETEDSRADLSLRGEEGLQGCASIFRNLQEAWPMHPIFQNEDENIACNEALSFIPTIETVPGSSLSMENVQTRCLLIAPILTSCYNRHGGTALIAVEGLFHLLTKTDFFGEDVELSDDGDDESCHRLTLLDLTIQVVCDVATCGAQETSFGACVEFVETAVRYCQAQLNTRTIGYVIRFYLFVFYFGASVPTTNPQWPNPAWGAPPATGDDVFADTVSILYDPRTKGGSDYLPGGAPQSAALALKEMISLCLVRLGKVSVSNIIYSIVQDPSNLSDAGGRSGEGIGSFLDRLLSSRVDDAVAHVERANLVQLALHQIHRSGGSELFWHDMVNACGVGLFGRDPKLTEAGRDIYTMTFALMANLTKIAYGKSRPSTTLQEALPRDTASKMLSLELLLHFLEYWSDQQEAVCLMGVSDPSSSKSHSNETLAFIVRRMIAPCLLSNTKVGLENSAVFSRLVRIVFELWKSPIYRQHCKAELGVLIEQFVVRLLHLGPQLLRSDKVDVFSDKAGQSLHFQQLTLLRELKRVFVVEPKQAVELFINYDSDFVFQDTGTVQLLPGSQWKLFQKMTSALSSIAEQCGEVIGRQIEEHRSMIDSRNEAVSSPKNDASDSSSSNKASIRESARLLRTASLEALSQIVRAVALSAGASVGPEFSGLFASWSTVDAPVVHDDTFDSNRNELSIYVETPPPSPSKFRALGSSSRKSKEKAIDTAADIAGRKTLKKAVEYLIACNVLPPTPRDIATFLRIHKERFDPAALGLYLGESGIGGSEGEYWNAIRVAFVRPISFVGMNVVQGLRHFLTHCGFILPGEAQKIDRIINTFAQCYYEDNAGDLQLCPFRNEDTVYMLSFAIIMLNTDLHKNTGTSNRGKKMSKTDFIQNLRGVEQGDDIPRQYLSEVYDSIEETPIALDEHSSRSSDSEDNNAILQDMLNSVRSAASLLHSLAVHDFKFATLKDVVESRRVAQDVALGQITRDIVSKTWHHWHGVISTCLETAHLDLQGMESCVDMLLYALATSVCLDMKMEASAFLAQLGRLKSFEELRQGRWVHAPDNEAFRGEDWYLELEEACNSSEERRLWALRNIREWMESVQGALLEDVCSKAELTRAVSQLENGDTLLQDPARNFIRSGDLFKKSGRTGRAVDYRFFLFSDILVYAKPEASGRYKIHEELPLYQMKVVDWYPSTQKSRQRSFDIHHPRKKFQVICADANERQSWVSDIRSAITFEVERKMKLEAARLAVITKAF
eukprot:scaffold3361_cov166-Amphora_coffeaeformis.AAC.6